MWECIRHLMEHATCQNEIRHAAAKEDIRKMAKGCRVDIVVDWVDGNGAALSELLVGWDVRVEKRDVLPQDGPRIGRCSGQRL